MFVTLAILCYLACFYIYFLQLPGEDTVRLNILPYTRIYYLIQGLLQSCQSDFVLMGWSTVQLLHANHIMLVSFIVLKINVYIVIAMLAFWLIFLIVKGQVIIVLIVMYSVHNSCLTYIVETDPLEFYCCIHESLLVFMIGFIISMISECTDCHCESCLEMY